MKEPLPWEIDADTMNLRLTLKEGGVVNVCLRGVLHESSLIHAVTRRVTSSSDAPPRAFRVSKEGKFSGIDAMLKNGNVTSVDEALKIHVNSLDTKKAKKRVLEPSAADSSDVEFVQEKTRAQRDEEGKANAFDVDDEMK